MTDTGEADADGLATVEGTVRSVVFHNDANGYTVLHVELPSEFELARAPEVTVVGRTQAVWEGEEVKAEQMLSQLYYFFINNPDVLPKEYYATVDNEGKERAVCDYIAGMTDRYAVNLYTRLFIPDSWKG